MIAPDQAIGRPVAAEARNLLEVILAHEQHPSKVAARQKVAGRWKDFTWGEVVGRSRRLAEGLAQLGIKPGDRVCIFASTRLEWSLSHFAILGAGAIAVPIYASNTPDEVEFIVNNCGARAVFFDHDRPEGKLDGRWARLKEIRARIPNVEHFIAYDLPSSPGEHLLSLGDLEHQHGEPGVRERPRGMEERARNIKADDLSIILYTSGTTGTPKGVMLSHGNWTYQARAIVEIGVLNGADTVLLFLPLAHSFAQVVVAAWLGVGFVMAFAEAIEKAVDNAAEVGATAMPAVPRVFEKAYAKVVGDGARQPGVKGKLFAWAMKLFEEYAQAKIDGRDYSSMQWTLARKLVFSKIEQKLKERFGGKMRAFVSGGAPLSKKVAYFFDVCGLLILEGYGLTETSAPTHVNRPDRRKIGTVGIPMPQVEQKIAEDGEILLRGPQVMKGYYQLAQDTAAMLEPDGWLHSGDIGEIDAEGFLKITDRKKDLIKTSGGKYIAPQELENALKTEPLVSQVLTVGDRRPFVTALVTLSEENAVKWAQEKGIAGGYGELVKHPEVRAKVQGAVDALNATLPSYSTIKKFEILDEDWSQATGELTPKLSVRRKVVETKYKALLDKMYGAEKLE